MLVLAMAAGCTDNGGGDNGGGESGATPTESSAAGDGAATGVSGRYEKVVGNVLRSVVQITTAEGLGSGVVYDDKGDIVTNAHVVGGATRFKVTTAKGTKPISASLVASYPPNDIAVIKVSGDLSVPAAKFANSGKVKIGEQVLAMGSPLGLAGSVTDGIVSATDRTVQEPRTADSAGTTIADMIQTSAAINPGNSGGALVDMSSKVIGVPTLAATDQQEGGAAPGIGFALASNTVTRIADQIIKHGKVTNSGRAALGVTVRQALNDNYRPAGALVVSLTSGSPAKKAGIDPGDVITKLGGQPVAGVSDLTGALAEHKPGDTVKVTVTRDGSTTTISVKLGKQ